MAFSKLYDVSNSQKLAGISMKTVPQFSKIAINIINHLKKVLRILQ